MRRGHREVTGEPDGGTRSPAGDAPTLRAHRGLVTLCVLGAVLETALVSLFGPTAALALAPQVTAPAPFAVFHDLRWLLVYTPSWAAVAAGILAFLGVRTAVTALTVRLAWPRGVDPMPWRALLIRSLPYTLAAAVLLAGSASLLVAFALASVSYLWFAALPIALAVAMLIHHGPVAVWWRHHPTLRTAGWAALTFLVLTLGGATLTVAPTPLRLPAAAAVGLFNAWAWLGIVRGIACRQVRVQFVPVAPAGLAALALSVLIALTVGSAPEALAGIGTPEQHAPSRGRPVLLASGYGVGWRGAQDPGTLGPGLSVRRYSYAGVTDAGQPLPYRPEATRQPLPRLVDQMQRQVRELAAESGRPVDIVAESEGALIAEAYLLTTRDAPVRRVVLLSPLVQPGRASYPPDGQAGYGLAAGWQLRRMSAAMRALTPVDMPADSPFLRSLADHARALGAAAGCPHPGVEQLAVLPLADAVGTPYGAAFGIPTRVAPALHGRLYEDASALQSVGGYLRTGQFSIQPPWVVAQRLVRAAAAAWQAPDLSAVTDRTRAEESQTGRCRAAREELRGWLG